MANSSSESEEEVVDGTHFNTDYKKAVPRGPRTIFNFAPLVNRASKFKKYLCALSVVPLAPRHLLAEVNQLSRRSIRLQDFLAHWTNLVQLYGQEPVEDPGAPVVADAEAAQGHDAVADVAQDDEAGAAPELQPANVAWVLPLDATEAVHNADVFASESGAIAAMV